MRLVLLISALTLTAGCNKPRNPPEQLAKELELMSHDQCIDKGITEPMRKRAVARMRTGKKTEADLDAYMDDIREKVSTAKKRNLSIDSFCQVQVNLWKKHFGG